jgi:hypothetical protein
MNETFNKAKIRERNTYICEQPVRFSRVIRQSHNPSLHFL